MEEVKIETKFPMWHQPDPQIGAILVSSQEELDAHDAAGWPHGKKPKKAEVIAEHAADLAPAVRKGGRPKKA